MTDKFSIDIFKSQMTSGLARGTLFEVVLPQIPAISDIDVTSDFLNLMCESVTLPGRDIETIKDNTFNIKGNSLSMAFTNNDINISFYVTNDWKAWNYINRWLSLSFPGIRDKSTPIYVGYKNDYAKDVTIRHYDQAGSLRKQIKLINAFPTSINQIDLSNNATDIIKCTSTLMYDQWYDET